MFILLLRLVKADIDLVKKYSMIPLNFFQAFINHYLKHFIVLLNKINYFKSQDISQ